MRDNDSSRPMAGPTENLNLVCRHSALRSLLKEHFFKVIDLKVIRLIAIGHHNITPKSF